MHKSFWSALWTTFPYFMLNIVIILKMFTVKILQEYVNQTDNSHLGLGRDCKPNVQGIPSLVVQFLARLRRLHAIWH